MELLWILRENINENAKLNIARNKFDYSNRFIRWGDGVEVVLDCAVRFSFRMRGFVDVRFEGDLLFRHSPIQSLDWNGNDKTIFNRNNIVARLFTRFSFKYIQFKKLYISLLMLWQPIHKFRFRKYIFGFKAWQKSLLSISLFLHNWVIHIRAQERYFMNLSIQANFGKFLKQVDFHLGLITLHLSQAII